MVDLGICRAIEIAGGYGLPHHYRLTAYGRDLLVRDQSVLTVSTTTRLLRTETAKHWPARCGEAETDACTDLETPANSA